jgi:molybdopterin-guanine dinucleotide biosynthesis protein MobB
MTGAPAIGIAGYKNAGKTTLAERLIAELTQRGYRVSTVKHAHHSVDLDEPGRDSYRHREAGAHEVALATSRRLAIMRELRGAPEPSLFDILARLDPVDLVIVEGFKAESFPKIEVRRRGMADPRAAEIGGVIAIASDAPIAGADRPVLPLDDIAIIADFIVDRFSLEAGHARATG